jgi:hypothetical protein
MARRCDDHGCWMSCGRGGLSLLRGETFWPILRRRWACSDPGLLHRESLEDRRDEI